MTSQTALVSARFIHAETTTMEDLGDGIRRQILGYGTELMAVRVLFEQGAVGQMHAHSHTQTSYVESGRFLATIDGESREVGPGDALYMGPHEEHGTVCLEAGVVIDMFSPMRADFLGIEEARS